MGFKGENIFGSQSKYLFGKDITLQPGSSNDNFTGHVVLGWFISGLGRETGPSGASAGTMAMEHTRTEGKVKIKSDIQK